MNQARFKEKNFRKAEADFENMSKKLSIADLVSAR